VSLVDEFVFPKSGIGQATEKLREKVEKLGGKVFLKSEVETLLTSDKKVKSIIIKSSGRKKEIRADEFVSSMPIDELVTKVIPKAKKDVLTKAGKLKYRDEIFVAIFVKKDRVTPDNWVYVQDPKIGFVRFQEMGNFSPFLSPKGTTSLVFEFPCNKDDATWQKSDKEMINWAIKDFTKEFGLITNKNILSGFVYRQEKTYPTYTLDYQSLLKVVKEFVYSFSNLQIIGRSGMFRYNNMDHSVATGLYAARNIIAGKKIYDIEAVNLEKEYHEEKRVKKA
jgi:protoporphyrinogen oxidase